MTDPAIIGTLLSITLVIAAAMTTVVLAIATRARSLRRRRPPHP